MAFAIHPTSAPEQNALPLPARTTARTERSSAADAAALVSAWMTFSSIALRTSGRFNVMRRIGPSRSMTTADIALHPENTEPGIRDRRIECGRQPECQRVPRLGRIEDSIVPQAGG